MREKTTIRLATIEQNFSRDVVDEAILRIQKRTRRNRFGIAPHDQTFLEKNPFLNELRPINGFSKSYMVRRLGNVHGLRNPPSSQISTRERLEKIISDAQAPQTTFAKRVLAMENLRSIIATQECRHVITEFLKKKDLRLFFVEALECRESRPLLEETCLTVCFAILTVGPECARKTTKLLARTIIGELKYHLLQITQYCDAYRLAKSEFLDQKLILGERARKLMFWFPKFTVDRSKSAVHHAATSLLYYTLAFLLYHSRQILAIHETAVAVKNTTKPLRFHLLAILQAVLGYMSYKDFLYNPKVPKSTFMLLSSITDQDEFSKDTIVQKMAAVCCRKIYLICQNTILQFRFRPTGFAIPRWEDRQDTEQESVASSADERIKPRISLTFDDRPSYKGHWRASSYEMFPFWRPQRTAPAMNVADTWLKS